MWERRALSADRPASVGGVCLKRCTRRPPKTLPALPSTPVGISFVLFGVAWLLLSAGVYLVLTGRRRRNPRTLAERLRPYHHASLADEAEAWLKTSR